MRGCRTGAGKDQWDMNRRIVDGVAVRRFVMFSERFAVISNDDDQRSLGETSLVHEVDQSSDLGVDVCDFGIVWLRFELISEQIAMRQIRMMWIVIVNPTE